MHLTQQLPHITRTQVQEFEREMRKHPLAKGAEALKVFHHFLPGIYMRELHIPADTITVGKIHKYPCWNILSKGKRLTIVDGKIEEICAPHMHLSPAGIKRVSYTIEDSVWITLHFTAETNISRLENSLVCDTEDEYRMFLAQEKQKCLS